MISKINTDLENLNVENVTVSASSDPAEALKVIGLFAPIIIAILEAWKYVPGRRMKSRNEKLDIAITALKATSIFYNSPIN